MRLEAGEMIGGRYSLVRPIGEGGMGAVWAAHDAQANELVALKVLRAEAKVPEVVRRFLREARAAMAVKHPNVVRIHEVVMVDDEPVIVMDFLEGESLASRLEKVQRVPLSQFARIFVAVVSAIGTAHSLGIVHRDLKPDNIFLVRLPNGGEEPRVVDFGIAKLTAIEGDAKHSGHLTTTGSVLGTPYYMSPEQVFGDKNIDHRTDIWALGAIAFECLSGRRPVDGDNIGQLLKVITTNAIPKLEQVIRGLPPDIYELVGRMLSYDRASRPYDLREVLNIFARHSDQYAQSFGEVTLLPGAVNAPARSVSPTADTLAEPVVHEPIAIRPYAADPLTPRSALATTTSGASMQAAGAVSSVGLSPSTPAPARSSGSGRIAGIAAALIAAVIVVGFGVKTMALKTTSTQIPSAAAPLPATIPTPITPEIAPSASVAPAVSVSASVSASPSAPLFGGARPAVTVRRPAPSASAAAAIPAPAVSAPKARTGADLAGENDNPYK